jgi:hypothetical protein
MQRRRIKDKRRTRTPVANNPTREHEHTSLDRIESLIRTRRFLNDKPDNASVQHTGQERNTYPPAKRFKRIHRFFIPRAPFP